MYLILFIVSVGVFLVMLGHKLFVKLARRQFQLLGPQRHQHLQRLLGNAVLTGMCYGLKMEINLATQFQPFLKESSYIEKKPVFDHFSGVSNLQNKNKVVEGYRQVFFAL